MEVQHRSSGTRGESDFRMVWRAAPFGDYVGGESASQLRGVSLDAGPRQRFDQRRISVNVDCPDRRVSSAEQFSRSCIQAFCFEGRKIEADQLK